MTGVRASGRPTGADDVLGLFAQYADELAASRRRVLVGLPEGDGFRALRQLLQGGKMARALVVHMAGDAAGGCAGGRPVGPAADAVELLLSLIHI